MADGYGKMHSKIISSLGLALALASCKPGGGAPKSPNYVLKAAGADNVKALLRLEIADTDNRRRIGLSRRKDLPADAGMLFIFDRPGHYTMWMKDTFIPLDIIFLNDDMVITYIAADRQPMNETLITPCSAEYEKAWDRGKAFLSSSLCSEEFSKSDKLTRYVLELGAGSAAKYGVRVGDSLAPK